MTRISDRQCEREADDILALLKEQKPSDAWSILTTAYYKLIVATYRPEDRADALQRLYDNTLLIKSLLNEEWV